MDKVENAYEDVKRNIEQLKSSIAQMENLLEMVEVEVTNGMRLAEVVNRAETRLDPRYAQNPARGVRAYAQQMDDAVWNLMLAAQKEVGK